jgi:hypothetical protein
VIGCLIEPIWLGNTLSKHGLSIWWMEHYNLDSNQHMWWHLGQFRSFWKLLRSLPTHTKQHTYEIDRHCCVCDKVVVIGARQPTMNTHRHTHFPCLWTPHTWDPDEIMADLLRSRTCRQKAHTSQKAHSKPPLAKLHTPHILDHTNQACTHTPWAPPMPLHILHLRYSWDTGRFTEITH